MKVVINPSTFLQQIDAYKKVSRLNNRINVELIGKFFHTIDFINNLPYSVEMINGRNIADWKIQKPIAEFILPRRVVLNDSHLAVDYMDKDVMLWNDDTMLDYDDFIQAAAMILGALRSNEANVFSISVKDKRVDAMLTNVIEQTSSGDSAHYDGTPYMPIAIVGKHMRNAFYNETLENVMTDFLRDWLVRA